MTTPNTPQSRRRAKIRRSVSGKAFDYLVRSDALYAPRDSTKSGDTALEAKMEHIDKQITRITSTYKLKCSDAELLSVVSVANDEYQTWRYHNAESIEGLGDKTDIKSLVAALKRTNQLLHKIEIRNRLAKAVHASNVADLPTHREGSIAYVFGGPIFISISHSRAQVAGLLAIALKAEGLDGRDNTSKRRDDLRSAAHVLRTYWTDFENRPGTLHMRRAPSRCLSFIYDCLLLIDPTVTQQFIADLDKD